MDKKYSRSHLENVKSMISSLNNSICSCIENSRALNFDNVMWKSIFDYGSLTPANSEEIGLVDSTPPVDPLISLLDVNKDEAEKKQEKKLAMSRRWGQNKARDDGKMTQKEDEEESARKKMEEKFGINESFTKFTATEAISLAKYRQMLNKKTKVERRRKQINMTLQNLSEKSTATSMILSILGFKPDKVSTKREKIAVVTVDGNIGSSLSYEIVRSLRRIRKDKDVKCVVLRVNSPGGSVISSEAILEEMKLFNKVSKSTNTSVLCSLIHLPSAHTCELSTACCLLNVKRCR